MSNTDSSNLERSNQEAFVNRHIGPDDAQLVKILSVLGYETLDELSNAVVPEVIKWVDALEIPQAATEPQALAELAALASANKVMTSMIGLGYSDTITPAVIRRNVLESPYSPRRRL